MLDTESRLVNELPIAIKKLARHKILVMRFVVLFRQKTNVKIEPEKAFLESLIKNHIKESRGAPRIFGFTLKYLRCSYKEDLKKVKDMVNSN